MKRYFSPSTQGFYINEITYSNLPDDLVEVSEDEHLFLLDAINIQKQEVFLDENKKLSTRDRIEPITWKSIRSSRNRLLAQSDYTQMPDWPGDRAAWSAYRQQLRDIPQTFTNPADVIWPTTPGE